MFDFYLNAPAWGSDEEKLPNGDPNAVVLKTAPVRHARVIHVEEEGAKYRDSIISGTFALADNQSDNLGRKMWKFVDVQVLWYGHKLKKQCPQFHIDLSKTKVEIDYSGRVVSNIGTRKRRV